MSVVLGLFLFPIRRVEMRIVHGSRVVSLNDVEGLTRGRHPGWLSSFITLLLNHPSEVILGVRIEGAKIMTNESISWMKPTSNGFRYFGPIIEWEEIKGRATAEEALALLVSKLPKAPPKRSGFA